jgi:hypothetical protein
VISYQIDDICHLKRKIKLSLHIYYSLSGFLNIVTCNLFFYLIDTYLYYMQKIRPESTIIESISVNFYFFLLNNCFKLFK